MGKLAAKIRLQAAAPENTQAERIEDIPPTINLRKHPDEGYGDAERFRRGKRLDQLRRGSPRVPRRFFWSSAASQLKTFSGGRIIAGLKFDKLTDSLSHGLIFRRLLSRPPGQWIRLARVPLRVLQSKSEKNRKVLHDWRDRAERRIHRFFSTFAGTHG